MEKKQFVRMFAGTVITAGFLGKWLIKEYIYLVDLFAGINLLQSSLTGSARLKSFTKDWRTSLALQLLHFPYL